MTLTDTQVSRLTAALDKQLEADKKFEAKTQAIINSLSSSSPPALAPGQPREADTVRDKGKALLDIPPTPQSAPAASHPSLPQVFEDRYAKGWSDACDFIRPQQYELQRRYVWATRRLVSLDRWVKWLPVVCFCCTLFGFALGSWCVANLAANRAFAQQLEIIPKIWGDRSDKNSP
jgi:hypothetical protein